MTTHIEHAITEVIVEPDSETTPSAEGPEMRWSEQQKIQSILARTERLAVRVRAEGFDD